MKIPRHVLAEAIAKKTMHIADSKAFAREVAAYLLAERRVADLESILRDILQFRQDNGQLEAEVVTVHDLQPHVLGEVKQLLQTAYPKAKEIHVSERHDSSVIGGLRIDLANERLDLTVASKLATFKRLTAGENN